MAKEIEIKKLDILSVAKIYAIIGAIIGFVIGIITAIVVISGGGIFMMGLGTMSGLAIAIGVLSIIIMPIIYGIIGFLVGLIFSWLYNVIAERIGGIKFQS